MGQGRSHYFLGATGLFPRSKELPISIQSLRMYITKKYLYDNSNSFMYDKEIEFGVLLGKC